MAKSKWLKLSGLTLMELVVVIGILGIMATIAIAALNPIEQLRKGRDARRRSDLKTLQTAMETYKVRNENYPTDFNELLNSGEIKSIPPDPNGDSYMTTSSLLTTKYCICAKMERPQNQRYLLPSNGDCMVAGFGLPVFLYGCVSQSQ